MQNRKHGETGEFQMYFVESSGDMMPAIFETDPIDWIGVFEVFLRLLSC